tara:strand:- start:1198 stop:1848 length:651 start_codon:yes stop_codon:yes gene_type:complete
MMQECKRIVMLGPPGVGKGTQAKMLVQALGLKHIASGELFRRNQTRGTALGVKAQGYISFGNLVPDEITIAMVLQEVLSDSSKDGFILDGFPRNMIQVESLHKALQAIGTNIDCAVLLTVPREELLKRLTGRRLCTKCQANYHLLSSPPVRKDICNHCDSPLYQREDDMSIAVNTRLEVYYSETAPIIDYYEALGCLKKIDGIGAVGEVARRISEL